MPDSREAVREPGGDEAFPIATSSRSNGDHAGYVDLRLDACARYVEAVYDIGEIHTYTDPICGVP